MVYQIIWFALWGLLWAVYFMLDGFDFGTGILHPSIAKTDEEKRILINTLGPVWDGNEVWLITAGGATFAAFPTTYAYMFSYLYTPLLLLLFALIFRGVAFEFRGKKDSESWKKWWDIAIFLGSLVPTILFGVAFGNIFAGLPIDENGYHGSLIYLLNPYGLITGIFFLVMFLDHGALWIAIKTTGDLSSRAKNMISKIWPIHVVIAVIFLIFSAFKTNLFVNYINNPVWFIVPIIAVISLLSIFFLVKNSPVAAFFASCLHILTVTFTGIIGLFPNLIPSNIDSKYSLTAFNSSSSPYTLKVMTIVVIIFVPIVLLYQIWTYKIFKDPVKPEDLKDPEVEAY